MCSKSHGSGRVGPRGFVTSRVGSDRVSGRVELPCIPTRPALSVRRLNDDFFVFVIFSLSLVVIAFALGPAQEHAVSRSDCDNSNRTSSLGSV